MTSGSTFLLISLSIFFIIKCEWYQKNYLLELFDSVISVLTMRYLWVNSNYDQIDCFSQGHSVSMRIVLLHFVQRIQLVETGYKMSDESWVVALLLAILVVTIYSWNRIKIVKQIYFWTNTVKIIIVMIVKIIIYLLLCSLAFTSSVGQRKVYETFQWHGSTNARYFILLSHDFIVRVSLGVDDPIVTCYNELIPL